MIELPPIQLSIIIVNWNTRDFLVSCLNSIFSNAPRVPYEVIVVDNNSQDGSAEAVRNKFPKVALLEERTNWGYAHGNNLGISRATGDYILTLNPDTEVFADTFHTALNFMDQNPSVGVIGAKQIGIDGNAQNSIRGFPTVGGVFWETIGIARRHPGSRFDSYRLANFDYEMTQSAPQPMGTFLLFRRAALESIGSDKTPFDEQFPIFFNEVDLLFRLKQAGWPCWYVGTVCIKHHGGESTKLVRKSIIWESHRSLLRYWKKHAKSPWDIILLALAWFPVLGTAFWRAKGYDKGFRPDGYHLQLEHTGTNPKMP